MPLSNPIFRRISRLADAQGVRAFVVGGYVRDHYLRRPSTDIDVVVVGSGIALAEALAAEISDPLEREELAVTLQRLGDQYADSRQLDDAAACYQRAIALCEALVA